MPRALISTVPFAQGDDTPIRLMEQAGIDYVLNPIGRKLREDELADMVTDFDVLIAGTEPITAKVMDRAGSLKLISRIGIGLDSVDLRAARERGIRVCYTPDAPANAVSDLTIGLLISLLRHVHEADGQMRLGNWQRYFGRRIGEITIGLIGMGRIGMGVMARLGGFGAPRILVNDIAPNRALETAFTFEWVGKETLYREADAVSLHVPLTAQTRDMICRAELEMMKSDAVLINTSRGGIVNEADLYEVLQTGHLSGAALDVFVDEPYDGPLAQIERCLLTAHMGSMSVDCRTRMEIEATQEAVRFLAGAPLESEVPERELENQR